MSEAPYIAFERTAFRYSDESVVFEDLNLTIGAGEYVCLLGGNGTGKSTIAKLTDALLRPGDGRVLVFGRDTRDDANTFFIRSNTGLVFQNPDDQLVASLIENEVAFGPENMGLPPEELRERVTEALDAVGLRGFERHETAALSGGQKQRVAIAGALAMRPAILVFDEATAMLDPRGRASMMRLIDELHERGLTIVTITHYMDEAARAERVVVLEGTDHGAHVALDGTPDEVLSQADKLRNLELAVPFACDFALRLRDNGVNVTPTVHEDALIEELVRMRKNTVSVALSGDFSTPGTSCPPVEMTRKTDVTSSRVMSNEASEAASPCVMSTRASDSTSPCVISREASEAASPCVISSGASVGERSREISSQPGKALIRFEQVSYTYEPDSSVRKKKRSRTIEQDAPKAWGNEPGSDYALRDINLGIHRGEMVGLAGHTGSGKSTLIQHMNGLLHPTAGRVLFEGRDLADKPVAREARRQVGLVFQYPEHQLFAATVYDDVAFGPRNLGLSPEEVDGRVRTALQRVNLNADEFAARSPFELSGGQQRKAALAGILAMEPEVLILDEPAAGLDPRTRAEFLALVKELHESGLTVVMASHSMEDLARLCDRIIVLDKGRISMDGAPLAMFEDEQRLRAGGLAQPAPLAMAQRLRECGFALSHELYTAATLAQAIAPYVTGA